MAVEEKKGYVISKGRQWKRRAADVIPDIRSALVELVTNSVDNYVNISMAGDKAVFIMYNEATGRCKVVDYADGMSFSKLESVVSEYGGATSGMESGKHVRGHFGLGLKDVAAAMETTEVFTIHEGKLSIANFILEERGLKWTLRSGTSREKDQIAKEYGIKASGTVVVFKPPRTYKVRAGTLHSHLLLSWPLRKILTAEDFHIILMDEVKKTKKRIIYTYPDGREILSKDYSIQFKNKSYLAKLKLLDCSNPLTQIGIERLGGLLIVYNRLAVADCILFGFDRDQYGSTLFGEIDVPELDDLLKADENVIEDTRRGINKDHPFIIKLSNLIVADLQKIIDEKRKIAGKTYNPVNINNISKLLSLLNRIAKKELEEIDKTGVPLSYVPENGMGFYYSSIEVKQKEPKRIFLVIDTSTVEKGDIIKLTFDKEGFSMKPDKVVIGESNCRHRTVNSVKLEDYKISIIGEDKVGKTAKLTAKAKDKEASVISTIITNEKLSLLEKKGIAFFPSDYAINTKKRAKLTLYASPDVFDTKNGRYISLEMNKDIGISIHDKANIEDAEEYVSGIKLLILPISMKNIEKNIGKSVDASAKYGEYSAVIKVTITNPIERISKGLFTDVKPDPSKCGNEIAVYDTSDKIIYLNPEHPVLKYYQNLQRDYETTSHYNLLLADIISRVLSTAIVDELDKKGKLNLLLVNPADSNEKYQQLKYEYAERYKKYGGLIHKIFMQQFLI